MAAGGEMHKIPTALQNDYAIGRAHTVLRMLSPGLGSVIRYLDPSMKQSGTRSRGRSLENGSGTNHPAGPKIVMVSLN